MLTALGNTASVRRINPEFGEWVQALFRKHGLSLRAARIRTGIDHVTLSDMAAGYVPRLEQIERLAAGFGLDANEVRERAGYPRISESDRSGADVLWDSLEQLQAENPEVSIPLPRLRGGWRNLTPEEAESIAADLRDKLRRGVL